MTISVSVPWTATILSIQPQMFPGPLGESLAGRALGEKLWALQCVDIRDFASDRHRSVDDTPAGGGAGMVLRADVLASAIDNTRLEAPAQLASSPLIYMSPRGRPLTQQMARELSQKAGVMILCGRFEGVDQRLLDGREIEEVSIGDYILSGGEIAAMVLVDAVVRLLPGVIGSQYSLESESHENGLLEYPHYTRPRRWEGRDIPDVLLSGDHGKIARWRHQRACEITRARRPDMWAKFTRDKG